MKHEFEYDKFYDLLSKLELCWLRQYYLFRHIKNWRTLIIMKESVLLHFSYTYIRLCNRMSIDCTSILYLNLWYHLNELGIITNDLFTFWDLFIGQYKLGFVPGRQFNNTKNNFIIKENRLATDTNTFFLTYQRKVNLWIGCIIDEADVQFFWCKQSCVWWNLWSSDNMRSMLAV